MNRAISVYTDAMAKQPKITKRPTLGEMFADPKGSTTEGLRNRRAKAPPVGGRRPPVEKAAEVPPEEEPPKADAENADEPRPFRKALTRTVKPEPDAKGLFKPLD